MTLRLYRGPADLPGIEAVRTACQEAEGDLWLPGPSAEPDPDGDPYCLIAEHEGEIVGYTWMPHWTEVDGTRLYLLLGWVKPAHRGRGLGRRMLAWQEERAAELVAREQPAKPMLGGNADDTQESNRELLLAAGYKIAFTVVHLECAPTRQPAAIPDGFEIRPMREIDHPAVHRLIEDCFSRNGLGYIARDYQKYLADFADELTDRDLWHLAWAGDELAGLAISGIEEDGTADTPWVAVSAAHRRRGLAQALCRLTLDTLAARGVEKAIITTLQENPNDTVTLYESVGYRVFRQQPRYRKSLS
ncbi:GNAT family N-acetyltransferase [Longispora albida]|uniref:GNAT family N-acetyltransferase n=1 Tax=Longispora albida TaxID=203523 RepID=UPI000372847D|nr:GNAT family N-acetyltransferase [Longispora albida]